MLPGETIESGASPYCEDCDRTVIWDVYSSAAGYYIGTYCDCGPYSRESSYYQDYEEAYADFDKSCWLAR
jgi:hypothetical protein